MDAARGFEHFQRKAHHMKQRDRFHFIPGFQPKIKHRRLHRQRKHQQQIIARHAQPAAARNGKHGDKKQAGKQAGACLFQAEKPKFHAKAPSAAQIGARRVLHQPAVELIDHLLPFCFQTA